MEYTIGSNVFDTWKITKEIGRGSYGVVYEVEKESFGIKTTSALKVIRIPKSDADIKHLLTEGMDNMSVTGYYQGVVQRIIKEIELMSSLKACENVVRFEDHNIESVGEGIGWNILIRMELLTPLTDVLLKKSLSEREVIKLGMDLCKALSFCVRKGIVHRDVKPENVFVNEIGTYKIGDFGVSRTLDKTTGATKMGTENYMAPEIYLVKPYNHTVDIYSLGIVLYKLMNGNRLPFYPPPTSPVNFSDREKALIERMKGTPMAAPMYASEAFANVILKACRYQPSERYQNADEMYMALQQLLRGQDIQAGMTDSFMPNDIVTPIGHVKEETPDVSQVVNHRQEEEQESTYGLFGAGNTDGESTYGLFGAGNADGEATYGLFGAGNNANADATVGGWSFSAEQSQMYTSPAQDKTDSARDTYFVKEPQVEELHIKSEAESARRVEKLGKDEKFADKVQYAVMEIGSAVTRLAMYKNGKATMLPRAEAIPSYIAWTGGEWVIGQEAQKILYTQPICCYQLMDIMTCKKNKIIREGNGSRSEEDVNELLRIYFEKLKEFVDGFSEIPYRFEEFILPVGLSYMQRKRVEGAITAAKIGKRVHLFTDGAMAAFYYALNSIGSNNGIYLLLHLGACGTSVVLFESESQVIEVLAKECVPECAGSRMTKLLANVASEYVRQVTGRYLPAANVYARQLIEAVDAVKPALATQEEVRVILPTGSHASFSMLEKAQFERILFDSIAQIKNTCVDRILQKQQLNIGRIKNLIVTGGLANIIGIEEMILRVFGRRPIVVAKPDQIAVSGLAAKGQKIRTGAEPSWLLIDQVQEVIHVNRASGEAVLSIPDTTSIPTNKEQTVDFSAAHPDTTLLVYAGDEVIGQIECSQFDSSRTPFSEKIKISIDAYGNVTWTHKRCEEAYGTSANAGGRGKSTPKADASAVRRAGVDKIWRQNLDMIMTPQTTKTFFSDELNQEVVTFLSKIAADRASGNMVVDRSKVLAVLLRKSGLGRMHGFVATDEYIFFYYPGQYGKALVYYQDIADIRMDTVGVFQRLLMKTKHGNEVRFMPEEAGGSSVNMSRLMFALKLVVWRMQPVI